MSRRPHASARTALLLGVSLVGLCGLSACSDQGAEDARPTSSATSPAAPVLQPGRPGEANQSLTGTHAVPAPRASAHPADVRFMQNMIVHHAQAITMVDLARDGLSSADVRGMADRIRAEQKPEIGAMKRWLQRHRADVPPQADNPKMQSPHQHGSMPGMASREQLLQLQRANGPAKDKTFLTLMIRHHQGALSMVTLRDRAGGTDPDAEQLGNDIVAGQSSQIRHMERMLGQLPAT